MPSIDDKVVNMSFDNTKFESGVRTTIGSLDKLKTALTFKNSYRGLDQVSKSLGHFQFKNILSSITGLGNHIDEVGNKLHTLRLVGISVLSQIATRAIFAGAQLVKAFTLGPIIQGMDIYKTKLQAIQTILANTQAAGTKMKDVTGALKELNIYSNKTIYSFGQMTKNIGTFTAAGVALKPAVASIKGIANLAALSGSNADQAATAMYQLSQAISAGQVHLQDWNSVVNAGMGGAVFQRALATTAQAMGKIEKGSLKLVGPMKNVQIAGESFRQSLQTPGGGPSWLTSDVLTKTLATFTGDMTDAQLAASGFTKEQIKQIQQTAQTAEDAATQVKTFSQLMDVSKETIATGWSQTFEIVIGNLNEAKKLFTDISVSIGNFAARSAKARNELLQGWKDLGGRTLLIYGLKTAFQNLGKVLAPIKDAFRDIFPRETKYELLNTTRAFVRFAEALKPSAETVKNLHRTFAGVFAALDIGKQIIKGFIGVFSNLFHAAGAGTGGFLSFTASIGDFFVALDKAVRKGKGLEAFFNGITSILVVPIKIIKYFAQQIANMFAGFSPGGFSVGMDGASKTLNVFHDIVSKVAEALQGLAPALNKAISSMNFEAILQVIRTGLLLAIVVMIRQFIGGTTLSKTLGLFGNKLGTGLVQGVFGKGFGKFGGALGQLVAPLKTMQNELKARTLEEIAIAIALISASILGLSLIKPARMHSALGGLAIGIGELIAAMVAVDKLSQGRSIIKLPLIAASLIAFATAIDILTLAVIALSRISWDNLKKGLKALGILLGSVTASFIVLSKNAAGMVRASIAMTGIAFAINILVSAVKELGQMDNKRLAKGLGAVAGALVGIAAGMRAMPRGMVLQAAALVLISGALLKLTKVFNQLGKLTWTQIGKGLAGIGGALTAIAIAMQLMPKSIFLLSTDLLVVASTLKKIVAAIKSFSGMSWNELIHGLVGLGGALITLSLGLDAMSGSLLGAAALAIAATGLSAFVDALVGLSKISIGNMIKALIGMSAGIGIIAIAAALLTPSIPALLGFGAALIVVGTGLTLVGAGVALAGVGIAAITAALSTLAVTGPVGIGILIQAIIDMSKAFGEIGENVILGLLHIVDVIAKVAPRFVKAAVAIIDIITEATIKSAPKIAEAFAVILESALKSLAKHGPEIIQAGFTILIELLKGIKDNLPEVVTTAVSVVVTFANSLAKNINRLVRAGFTFVIKLVEGITNNIDRVVKAAEHIFIKFVKELGKNLTDVVDAGAKIIIKLVEGLGKDAGKLATAAGNAVAAFLDAVGNAVIIGAKGIAKFIRKLGKAMVIAAKSSKSFFDSAGEALVIFLDGLDRSINKHTRRIVKLGVKIAADLAKGIIQGLADGLKEEGKGVGKSVFDAIAPGVLDGWKNLKKLTKSNSPSLLFAEIGKSIVAGLVMGIDDNVPSVHTSIGKLGNNLTNALLDSLSTIDVRPTITPVLDLSSIEKDAGGLNNLFNKNPIGRVSLSRAATVSSEQAAVSAQRAADVAIPSGDTNITFEQKNYSPKALDDIEIYRRTRNELSKLKTVVVPG